MIKIGLVGEDPNDTKSVKNLLSKKYKGKIQFCTLVKGIRGYQIDNPKIKRALPVEFASQKCKFILYIRDQDGFKSELDKHAKCDTWFKDLDSHVNNRGIFLLNTWELEALIFSDIETFNRLYKTRYKPGGDPMMIKEPKEKLMELTRNQKNTYKESHCPEIFEELDFDTVAKNCKYFKDFIEELDKKIA